MARKMSDDCSCVDTYPETGAEPSAKEPANSTRNVLRKERIAKYGGEKTGYSDPNYGPVRELPSHK
jgi:hypothetical protein